MYSTLINVIGFFSPKGCDLNCGEKYGCTALLMAAKAGHASVVNTLIEAGANLDLYDTKGNTPLNGKINPGFTLERLWENDDI